MTQIRPFTTSDRSAWEQLFRAYIEFYERELSPAAYDRTWQELLADERIHGRGAWVDGELVGIVHFLTHANTWGADVCYLQDLFSAPAARGRGVGRALIETVTDWARGQSCERVYWLTQATNAAARGLYDSLATESGLVVYRRPL